MKRQNKKSARGGFFVIYFYSSYLQFAAVAVVDAEVPEYPFESTHQPTVGVVFNGDTIEKRLPSAGNAQDIEPPADAIDVDAFSTIGSAQKPV